MNILRQTDGYVYIDLTPSQFEECGVTQVDQPVVKIEGETYKCKTYKIGITPCIEDDPNFNNKIYSEIKNVIKKSGFNHVWKIFYINVEINRVSSIYIRGFYK